jgi:hypothetical protein
MNDNHNKLQTEWSVAVVRSTSSGPKREVYDCGIPNFLEAEQAVALLVAGTDILVVTALEPLTSIAVRSLGVEDGKIKKRG